MAPRGGDGQGGVDRGGRPLPRVRGGVVLHHVQPYEGGEVLHPAMRHDAVHDLRERGHQEDDREAPRDQERRYHEGRHVHAAGGGVPGRVRERPHDPIERRLLRMPIPQDHSRAVGCVQGGEAARDGQVGEPADERAGQLRGAAGEDEPVGGPAPEGGRGEV